MKTQMGNHLILAREGPGGKMAGEGGGDNEGITKSRKKAEIVMIPEMTDLGQGVAAEGHKAVKPLGGAGGEGGEELGEGLAELGFALDWIEGGL